MMSHQLHRALLLLCLIFFTASSASEPVCDAETETCSSDVLEDPILSNALALVEELKGLSGTYFSDKLEVRRKNQGDLNSTIGLFATQDIEKDELLLKLPPASLIRVNPTGDWEDDVCALNDLYLKEMKDGSKSKYATLIKYLKSTEITVPAVWSTSGIKLLEEMLFDKTDGNEDVSLPPTSPTILGQNVINCFNKNSKTEVQAIATILSKGFDFVLAPMWDIIQHSNGEKLNTKNTSLRRAHGIQVESSRRIQKGEQLYRSYNRCKDCEDIDDVHGTPELFRDRGFVEDYPQRFFFRGGPFQVEDCVFDVNKGNSTLSIEWVNQQMSFAFGHRLKYFKDHVRRLDQFKVNKLTPARNSVVPEKEWDLIHGYLEALMTGITLAIDKIETDTFDEEYTQDFDSETEYVLPEDKHAIDLLDFYRQGIYQSETLVWAVDHFESIESLDSEYQNIEYFAEPETGDTCFYLDNVWQMCLSYWPYYHEIQIHKAAKYIDEDVKRVLYVGAGDSGLLNEIVKYPSLELVVGLELDQHVARLAFKHMGARPHFDNEKVQWWFGDASKTLLMLPREYFGTFDMVQVDLSDTVLALTVSDELDVVGALSLLLKPGGIFGMNELFFKRVSDVFKYSIYYQFSGVPKILDQGFVFASNDVDFMYKELADHDIKDVHVENSLLKSEHQFHHVHDYRRNPSGTAEKLCRSAKEEKKEAKSQETSPGIFMALEAEDLSSEDLGSIADVKKTVEDALKSLGLHVVSSSGDSVSQSMFVSVLREGYIAARVFSKEKYVAFDILLWSSFLKLEQVQAALVESVGGKMESTSSFRIVTGGMFGVSTWKEDMKSHGPQIPQCTDDDVPVRAAPGPQNIFGVALEGSINLVENEDDFIVAIFCGIEDQPCESVELLENNERVGTVIPLYSCVDVESSVADLEKCARDGAKKTLSEAFSRMKVYSGSLSKVRMLVVDRNAPRSMEGILSTMSESDFFEESLLVMAMIDSQKDLWRRQVVDRVRRDVAPMDPVFRAHVLFNSTESSIELAVASSGDEYFMEHLKETTLSMQERLGTSMVIEIRNCIGGVWRKNSRWTYPDKEAMKLFRPKDYNFTIASKQYTSQKPLASQSIEQRSNMDSLSVGDPVEFYLDNGNGDLFESEVLSIDGDGNYIVYDDIGKEHAMKRYELSLVGGDKPALLTSEQVHIVFQNLFSGKSFSSTKVNTTVYDDRGEGSVLVAVWESGMAILIWDGRTRFDVNMFSISTEIFSSIGDAIQAELTHLKISLSDLHPRGTSKVVNFKEDLSHIPIPHWAVKQESAS